MVRAEARSGCSHNGGMDGVTRSRVLLVEDDHELTAMLAEVLTDEGYELDAAADGQRALHLGLTRGYDVLVLDRGLPAIEGLDVLTRLRSKGVVTPALVLSALGNPADRVAGLDAGAEDYLPKPFDLDELLARLRALRRRHLDSARTVPLPGGVLDLDARLARIGEQRAVRLSERECAVLGLLASRPTRVFSRSDLLLLVFDTAESDVIVDTYVHYLRRKLGRRIIDTVRGRGYQLGRGG
ncbi:response regulator transcription factor [Saccharopolyspora rosea]